MGGNAQRQVTFDALDESGVYGVLLLAYHAVYWDGPWNGGRELAVERADGTAVGRFRPDSGWRAP